MHEAMIRSQGLGLRDSGGVVLGVSLVPFPGFRSWVLGRSRATSQMWPSGSLKLAVRAPHGRSFCTVAQGHNVADELGARHVQVVNVNDDLEPSPGLAAGNAPPAR